MKRIRISFVLALFSLALIGAGVAVLFAIIHSQETTFIGTPPTAPAHVTPSASTISGEPISLSIPSLNMQLPIIPGSYNARTKTWTLTLNKVQYATITPAPNNQAGNTFMYGHYRPEVFAYLHHIAAGSQAVVTTANGHIFYYQLSNVRVVDPSDSSSIFFYQGPPILTLQTCTGLFFQNRQLFTFNLTKVV